mmetsp:Transcript_22075/g.21266  ORF Transcript_22075/g.21266 Transcript_22075/m.21266 type:complete len:96 (+) Transcript_22075:1491-1778(+)
MFQTDMKNQLQQMNLQGDRQQALYNSLGREVQQVIESLLVVNLVLVQEEADRKTLSLVGFNNIHAGGGDDYERMRKGDGHDSMVKLDKNCISCSS